MSNVISNLISFEGPDGSGKTLLSKLFVEKLKCFFPDKKIEWANIPTHDKPIGNFVRRILNGEFDVKNPLTIQYLIHAEDLEFETQLRTESKDTLFIRDRSCLSAVVYSIANATEFNIENGYLDTFLNFIKLSNAPKTMIYLNCSIETSLRRIQASSAHKSIYDNEKTLIKVNDTYNMILKDFSKWFPNTTLLEIDADGDSLDDKLNEILSKFPTEENFKNSGVLSV